MDTLAQIYARHSGGTKFNDKGTSHDYIGVYESLLAPYRETAKRVVEIGVFDGHSLRMFAEYFTNAEVHGIDCDEQPHGGKADLRPMISDGKHNIHIFDATDGQEVQRKFKDSLFDIVIDDAAHNIEQQVKLIEIWLPRLAPGGLHVVEDIQEIDCTRAIFESLGFKIIDRRSTKNRYDNVLAVFGGK